MALGGGTFISQNKALPGSYINFVSAARAQAALSERGVATMPLILDWGPDGEVFAVTAEEFQKNSLRIFGHAYGDEEMKGLRDLFRNIRTGYFYKLNTGGVKAANDLASAKYAGSRGNALKIAVAANEASSEEAPLYDVSTWLGSTLVDSQTKVSEASELLPNDFVEWKSGAALAATAGTPLTGGTDGEAENADYQAYLDKIESYSFNVMGCTSTDPAVKALFAAFTKRMRDECGVKFQTVLFRPGGADYEGVIGVENGLAGAAGDASAVYWATGAEAGCQVNRSLQNAVYTGEFEIDVSLTQAELEAGLKAGKFLFHRVGEDVRVLDDVNTFVSVTGEKSADFQSNQTVRVLDQIGNDIAALFNQKYLGRVPNDNAGRISLWNDIVKHHQELLAIRAIEAFSGDDVTVEAGGSRKSVVVSDRVQPVCCFSQLYMTVVVE